MSDTAQGMTALGHLRGGALEDAGRTPECQRLEWRPIPDEAADLLRARRSRTRHEGRARQADDLETVGVREPHRRRRRRAGRATLRSEGHRTDPSTTARGSGPPHAEPGPPPVASPTFECKGECHMPQVQQRIVATGRRVRAERDLAQAAGDLYVAGAPDRNERSGWRSSYTSGPRGKRRRLLVRREIRHEIRRTTPRKLPSDTLPSRATSRRPSARVLGSAAARPDALGLAHGSLRSGGHGAEPGQAHAEGRAATLCALHGDRATVGFCDRLRDRQPEPRPAVPSRTVRIDP